VFSSYLLHDALSDAIDKMGFTRPTQVQQAVFPSALEYKDVLVSARTGSGKTLAFLVPLLQHLLDDDTHESGLRAIILVPTRELARQINKQCDLLSEFTGLRSTTIIGGEDPKYQLHRLKGSPDIIIGTPGRLLEHIYREAIDPANIQVLVLDEADRMLSMGFSDQVKEIAAYCNPQRQTMLFSASLNHEHFHSLITVLLHQPETITLNTIREKHENIHHQAILVDNLNHRQTLLTQLIRRREGKKILVFANTREQVENIGRYLQQQEIPAGTLHGELEQKQRNAILSKLRYGNIQVLVATDLAARGLDVPDIDCVIQFTLARSGEDYAHRSGRTGRAEAKGTAIALIDANDWNQMIRIEHFLHFKFELVHIEGFEAVYPGPKKLKSSGKAASSKKKRRKKEGPKKTVVKKNRLRERKNIGKRRQPSVTEKQQKEGTPSQRTSPDERGR